MSVRGSSVELRSYSSTFSIIGYKGGGDSSGDLSYLSCEVKNFRHRPVPRGVRTLLGAVSHNDQFVLEFRQSTIQRP